THCFAVSLISSALRCTALRPHCVSRRTVIMPTDLPTLQRSPMPRQRLSSSGFMEYLAVARGSLRLDVRRTDHLGPLLCFLADQPPKVGGRKREHAAPHVGKPRLELGIITADISDDTARLRRPFPRTPSGRGHKVIRSADWYERGRCVPAIFGVRV